MRINVLLSSLVCVLIYNSVSAQLDNRFFDLNYFDEPLDSGHWNFSLDNLSVTRNTEYLNMIHYGRTDFGHQLLPAFNYQINKNAKISLGGFPRYDFGTNGFKEARPFYQFSYNLKNHRFIFGSLEGSLQHDMVEPIVGYDQIIRRRIEEGMQLKYDHKRWKYDVWIDWQKMIYPNSPFNEVIVAGYNVYYRPIVKEKHELRLNTQALTYHSAGEINQKVEPVVMFFNFAHGIDYEWRPNQNFSLFSSFYGVYHEDISTNQSYYFLDGLGQLVTLRAKYKAYSLVLNYWDAHEFMAPLGEGIFLSASDKNIGNPKRYRKMAMARLVAEKQINSNLSWMFRLGANVNIDHSAIDVVMENYIRWNIRTKPRKMI